MEPTLWCIIETMDQQNLFFAQSSINIIDGREVWCNI